MRKPNSRKLVTILLGTALACVFCAAQENAEKKNDTGARSAEDLTCDIPGGSAGGGTFTAKAIVSSEGDEIIFRNHKTCAVENPDTLKGHKGHHVQVTARVTADKKAIHVMDLKMLSSHEGEKAEKR